jgi:hypothetical protein
MIERNRVAAVALAPRQASQLNRRIITTYVPTSTNVHILLYIFYAGNDGHSLFLNVTEISLF